MSKGTPYLYFQNKEALFIALHEEWDCGTANRVNAAIAALHDKPVTNDQGPATTSVAPTGFEPALPP